MKLISKILIVEDDNTTAKFIIKLIIKLGLEVADVVDRGETAIVQARRLRPDLVLMDISLKGAMNGIQAANEIMKTKNIPIIYLTALSDGEILQEAQKSGPFGYVIKPFVSRELEVIIAAALYKKDKEQSLKDIEERHIFSLKSFRGISFRSDMDFIPVFINGPVEEIAGYREEDFINGKISWEELAHPEENPIFSDQIRSKFKEIPNFQINKEFRIISQKGETKWVRHFIKNVCNDRGEPISLLGTICDVTEYREIYESLTKMMIDFDRLKKATIDREIKMLELKREVDEMRKEQGKLPKYDVSYLPETDS